jgi:Cu-processing system permease protein
MHLYHSRNFIEMMLAQPVSRRGLFAGLYLGLATPLAGAYLIGVGVPSVLHGGFGEGAGAYLTLLMTGVLLTLIFVAAAFMVALRFDDRATGLGAALVLWLGVAVLFDGILLLGIALLGDWPLERPLLLALFLNPEDLGRVVLLYRFDLSALSGVTGAVFASFFKGAVGIVAAILAMLGWVLGPLLLGGRAFSHRDF